VSTSCIIALYSKEDDEIVLLEKTHDGFLENVEILIKASREIHNCLDIEDIAQFLIKNTDVRFSIYSHKYPCNAFIYHVDDNKFDCVKINPEINKISECLEDIKNRIMEIEKAGK